MKNPPLLNPTRSCTSYETLVDFGYKLLSHNILPSIMMCTILVPLGDMQTMHLSLEQAAYYNKIYGHHSLPVKIGGCILFTHGAATLHASVRCTKTTESEQNDNGLLLDPLPAGLSADSLGFNSDT